MESNNKEALRTLFTSYNYNGNYQELIEARETLEKELDRLEEYRKIEEEIGIDLITLFKALKYGVYYYTSQNQLTHDYVWLYDNYVSANVRDKLSYSLLTCFQKQILSFEDYGTTWSIYRENLEDDTD